MMASECGSAASSSLMIGQPITVVRQAFTISQRVSVCLFGLSTLSSVAMHAAYLNGALMGSLSSVRFPATPCGQILISTEMGSQIVVRKTVMPMGLMTVLKSRKDLLRTAMGTVFLMNAMVLQRTLQATGDLKPMVMSLLIVARLG